MKRKVTDQTGRELIIPSDPKRIISLVPSQTELLIDLGLHEKLVGITSFCIHPKGLKREKTIIGGTKTVDIQKVKALKPDFILGNKEENAKESVEALEKDFPVWLSDIADMQGNLNMIRDIGQMTHTNEAAEGIISEISKRFKSLSTPKIKPKVLYLIWRNPYMAAGKSTFIDAMLDAAGFQNALKQERYPELSEDDIRNPETDFIFLSSEPYPFRERHIEEFKALCPNAKTLITDGELFSWYGSRMLHSAEYFLSLREQCAVL